MEDVERTTGVREGDVLAGKYRIEKVLGIGGMGVVVAARHLQLETKVAIKFLLPEMLAHEEIVARFAREARAAVKITGENVARVLDVGTLETGAPFIVMEFLEGSDLHTWLQQRGTLATEQAVEFLLQACVAVAEAHSLGIVHRDLKPANLFCIRRADGKPSIKVLDFGISKVSGASPSECEMSVTKTSAMMGSPLYMSPEQMRSAKDADAQSDVWALGAILYELVTGRVPFDGQTVTEVAIKVATVPTPSMRTLKPDLPPGFEEVVFKALEKNRQDRYPSVAEFAIALGRFAPPRARGLVDRICGILQTPGWTSLSPPGAASPPPSVPPSVLVAGTMSAVGRTTAGLDGGRRRIVTFVLSSGAAMGVAALAIAVLHNNPFRERATAAAMVPPAVAATPVPAVTLSRKPTVGAALPPLAAEATDTPGSRETGSPFALSTKTPLATPETAAPKRTGVRPGQPRAPTSRAVAPAPSMATPPTPAPASQPAPLAPRNQLDLGNFQ